MAKKYMNIPVEPEVYEQVQLIAQSNNRGLGHQVKEWAERELPDCGHEKEAVTIQTFPNAADALMKPNIVRGWFCRRCNRVYQFTTPSLQQEEVVDPYGQPLKITKSKSKSKVKVEAVV